VITLSMDTSESRGSVAVRRGGVLVALKKHEDSSDYSAWLLPSVEEALTEAGVKLEQVDLLAAATGPGSFTGLRVGLTTVKAWAEVYGKPVVGVSRLEAMARSQKTASGFVAACYNAQRNQLFAALYGSASGHLAGHVSVAWTSLDPELITNLDAWKKRVAGGDVMQICAPEIASSIAILAEERALLGEFSDPLSLDANYVRRSDAEIFWKGLPSHVP
jgi:tRNA threonylcarbamoyladenosine biosynthesis protein TsaB